MDKRNFRVAVYLLALASLLAPLAFGATVVAQDRQRYRGNQPSLRKGPAKPRTPRYEVGKALDLNLSQCTGEINFSRLNVSAGLEIAAGQASLLSTGSVIKRGEVIAYSQSQYFLNANVALIFDRSDKPFTSSEWKPPVIMSLNMIQSRKNPRQFTLTSVPIGDSPITRSVILCVSAGATSE